MTLVARCKTFLTDHPVLLNRTTREWHSADKNSPALRAAPFTKGNNILHTPVFSWEQGSLVSEHLPCLKIQNLLPETAILGESGHGSSLWCVKYVIAKLMRRSTAVALYARGISIAHVPWAT